MFVQAGYTALHSACHFGQINMIRFLLDNGASVNASTKVIILLIMMMMMINDDDHNHNNHNNNNKNNNNSRRRTVNFNTQQLSR